jgi:1,2-phenylacetyl-CoA epoxidase catalytic subunit
MAQRAKKILQEEGSHRVHGEAWAKRLMRGEQREALVQRIGETWEHAGRWLGPNDDAGLQAALAEGMIARDAAAQREQVRVWLRELVEVELDEPSDWSSWDPQRRR